MRLLPRPPADVADPFDPECLDFVAYVARCHGLERSDAESVVQRWLTSYEPSPEARRALGSKGPKSGVFELEPCADQERTGTNG